MNRRGFIKGLIGLAAFTPLGFLIGRARYPALTRIDSDWIDVPISEFDFIRFPDGTVFKADGTTGHLRIVDDSELEAVLDGTR